MSMLFALFLALSSQPLRAHPMFCEEAFVQPAPEPTLRIPVNAAGVIVIRKLESQIQILLRQATPDIPGYTWSFAKGRMEQGESPEQTAVREAFEEMGLRVRLGPILTDAPGNSTRTRYFWAEVLIEPDLSFSGPETERLAWVNLDEAEQILNKNRDLNVLAELRRSLQSH